MARGNKITDSDLIILERFGLLIVKLKDDCRYNWGCYNEIYFSKRGTLIGRWGSSYTYKGRLNSYSYKDYITRLGSNSKVLRITDRYLIIRKG